MWAPVCVWKRNPAWASSFSAAPIEIGIIFSSFVVYLKQSCTATLKKLWLPWQLHRIVHQPPLWKGLQDRKFPSPHTSESMEKQEGAYKRWGQKKTHSTDRDRGAGMSPEQRWHPRQQHWRDVRLICLPLSLFLVLSCVLATAARTSTPRQPAAAK